MTRHDPSLIRGLVLLFSLASGAMSQTQFDLWGPKAHLPPASGSTQAVAIGDVDGDGDADLVVADLIRTSSLSTVVRLYLNEGAGRFTEAAASRIPQYQNVTHALALADVDRDGDADLVFATTGQNRLYLNDGVGQFVDVTLAKMPGDVDSTRALLVVDFDNDGAPEILCGNSGNSLAQNRIYQNDGSGRFVDVTATHWPFELDRTEAYTYGDIDADGDLDVISGNKGTQSRSYLNDGRGHFTFGPTSYMPVGSISTHCVELADLDGDSDLDLVCGSHGQDCLYLNDGNGRFVDVTSAWMPSRSDPTVGLVFEDLDGDGDADLVVGSSTFGERGVRVYINDGKAPFRDLISPDLWTLRVQPQALVSGDVDGDGDRDLLVGHDRDRLFLNDGGARFADATRRVLPIETQRSMDVVITDLNGDGHLDLFLMGFRVSPQLYFSDGSGYFRNETLGNFFLGATQTRSVVHGDVDGDGDQDLVVGFEWSRHGLFLIDGSGRFTAATATHMPQNSASPEVMLLDDCDGDGDLDLIIGNLIRPNYLFRNDGAGSFTDVSATHMPLVHDLTRDLAIGDVDNDGDRDLVVGNDGQNGLFLNDGSGKFVDVTATHLPVDSMTTTSVALGDVDGDGDLDLACAAVGNQTGAPNQLYLNDGTGRFVHATTGRLPADVEQTAAIEFADFDGDGDLDLVAGNLFVGLSGFPERFYANDGTGRFTDVTAKLIPKLGRTEPAGVRCLGIADLDGDEDRDVVLGTTASGRLVNQLRQLTSPWLAMLGREYRLDVYAKNGPPRASDTAVIFLSAGQARIPVPQLGMVGLDPVSTVPFPAIVIPQPLGVASVSVTIPNDPRIVGSTFHAQAVILATRGRARLTNVVTDSITR